jgi:hypothetical protein
MNNRKSPPYARAISEHPNKSELIVCTGKGGWARAKSLTWFHHTPKTVLPYGDDPAAYKWPVQNRAVMVFDFGPETEGYEQLIELSRQLLIDGAEYILLMSHDFPMTRVDGRREAA